MDLSLDRHEFLQDRPDLLFGPWLFRRYPLLLVHADQGWGVPLEGITSESAMCRAIMDIATKIWATDTDVACFVEALRYLFIVPEGKFDPREVIMFSLQQHPTPDDPLSLADDEGPNPRWDRRARNAWDKYGCPA